MHASELKCGRLTGSGSLFPGYPPPHLLLTIAQLNSLKSHSIEFPIIFHHSERIHSGWWRMRTVPHVLLNGNRRSVIRVSFTFSFCFLGRHRSNKCYKLESHSKTELIKCTSNCHDDIDSQTGGKDGDRWSMIVFQYLLKCAWKLFLIFILRKISDSLNIGMRRTYFRQNFVIKHLEIFSCWIPHIFCFIIPLCYLVHSAAIHWCISPTEWELEEEKEKSFSHSRCFSQIY